MTYLRASLVLLAALAASCGQVTAGAGGDCLTVSMAEGKLVTAPPSKVSLFFTVDTCGGQPVSDLSTDSFQLTEDDKPVSAFESHKTVQAKGQRFRMYSLLLLDISGSILESGSFPALADAAKLYVDQVLTRGTDGQRVAVYAFDGRASLIPVVEFSEDPNALKAGIDRLKERQCQSSFDCAAFEDHKSCSGWLCVDDSTNLNGAVVSGIDRLERELQVETGIPYKDSALVVFTDGTDQAARVSRDAALAKIRSSRPHLFTIGLGGEVDENAMRDFGRDGYQSAAQAEQLADAFREIATRVVGMASRFYLLEYCSPKRGGTHTLTVTATSSTGAVGSLTRSFEATGFGSGCELTSLPPASSTH